MKLYHAPGSCSDRIKTMLDVMDVEYDVEIVDLSKGESRSKEYLKINPAGQVPALEDDGHIFAESAAIGAYLAMKYPDSGIAPPVGTPEFAVCLQWLIFCTATFWPVLGIVSGSLTLNPEIEQDGNEMARGLLKVIEHGRQGTFQLGEQFSAADIFLRDMLRGAEHFGLLTSDYEGLQDYVARVDDYIASHQAG